MAIFSPEREAIATVVVPREVNAERFDPTKVTWLDRITGSDEAKSIFLRRTDEFPSIPGIGHYTVAVFDATGPAKDPATTEDILHRNCDSAVLLRPPLDKELPQAEEVARSRSVKPAYVKVAELLSKFPGQSGVMVPTGRTRFFVPDRVR